MPRHRSVLFNVVLCVGILVAGSGIFAGLAALKKPPPTKEPTRQVFNVTVFDVEAADLREIVIGFGTVVAEHEVQYSAQVSGEIVYIDPDLKVGQTVNAAPKSESEDENWLLLIDNDVYVEKLSDAQNALDEANIQLELLTQQKTNTEKLLARATQDEQDALAEFERAKKNYNDKVITEAAFTQARLEFSRYQNARQQLQNEQDLLPGQEKSLRKQVLSLVSRVKLAQIEKDRAEVRAPFSGVLSEVHVEKGQLVQPGTPLFRVTNLDTVEIAVPLHASDAAKINNRLKQGEQPPVELAVNETTQSLWTGRVTRIAPRADQHTRTIDVFVEVDNSQSIPLLPGSFVQARIEGPLLKNCITIPRDAVLGGDADSGRIFVVEEGLTKSRTVPIERRLEGMAFVGGEKLKPGEQLLLTNLDVVHEGSQVTVQNRRSLARELAGQTSLEVESGEQPVADAASGE